MKSYVVRSVYAPIPGDRRSDDDAEDAIFSAMRDAHSLGPLARLWSITVVPETEAHNPRLIIVVEYELEYDDDAAEEAGDQ